MATEAVFQQAPGLRDRKRIQTRARIEDAAVALVLHGGLEHTTVQAISERAEVSPRTFFNYFESKDAAILGVHNSSMIQEQVAEFLLDPQDREPIEAIVALLLTIFDVPSSRLTIREDRMELLRRHPELLASQFQQFTQTQNHVLEGAERILARDPKSHFASDGELSSIAAVTLMMCGTAVRIAMREPAEQQTPADAEQIHERAVQLVRETARRST